MSRRRVRSGMLGAGLLLAAACAGPADERPEPLAGPDTLAVELRIGVLDGDPDRVFGRISGLTLDAEGHVWVVDGQAVDVRAFTPAGELVRRFGRSGSGPGDLARPCCPGFDAAGRLWVWSMAPQATRWDVFDVDAATERHVFRITSADELLSAGPPSFAAGGHLIAHARESVDSSHSTRPVRLHVDSTGAVLRRVYPPNTPPRLLGMVEVALEVLPGRVQQLWNSVPFQASERVAHAPDGRFAYAVTRRYEVVVFNEAGDTIAHVRRPDEGPLLSPAERDSAAAKLASDEASFERMGATVSHRATVQERKPVLRDIFFDLDGRLWVLRTPADGDTHVRADVYERSGAPSFAVAVPANVDLTQGAIRGEAAYAIETGELDVQRIVRFRLPTTGHEESG
ncbi:MAG: hypothetical protein WEB88_17845 [Gemmatimonadota bacterium]